ncbi:hypothetical protein SKAU_G00265860 [Synaphobranchus kaupii]|uniref:Uncharacterized protein n=1 Tax=Synaphobranchus kaupii TaxID=118154 RepID=A0A9Q1EZA8_SYNKA|nr:hypothetical protein SKAU_G00265860 [Synaphobranchus kaupii]
MAPQPDLSPAGRISSGAVHRNQLRVGFEGFEGKVARRTGFEHYSPSAMTELRKGDWDAAKLPVDSENSAGEPSGQSTAASASSSEECS